MLTNLPQMTQSPKASSDQPLCEKSVDLRARSRGLLWEARELRNDSQRLKAKLALLVMRNPSANAARKRNSI